MEKVQANRNHYITLFFAFSFGMILSNLIGQSKQAKQDEDSYVLAYRGSDKTLDELPSELAKKLRKLQSEYTEAKTDLLEDAGIQFIVHDYARAHGVSLDDAAKHLFPAITVDESELADFFQANEKTIQQPYFAVKESIAKHLEQQKLKALRAEKLQTLIAQGDLIFYLPYAQSD